MKKVLFLLTSVILSLSLVSCAMGQCAKGYKYAKENIEYWDYQDYKVKFEGGNWVFVEEQDISNGNIFGFDLGTTHFKATYYYEIFFKATNADGQVVSVTEYYYYQVGESNSSKTSFYSTYRDAVVQGKLQGKTGTL